MSKNEIAIKAENFKLVTIEGEIADAIKEELDGLGPIPFDKVKIPSGGGLAFEVPGEDDENPETATEIIGVILYHYPVNAYWKEAYGRNNNPPDCSSLDGKKGVVSESGEVRDCTTCPYNQYGSGDNGSGKACKNNHRCYILRENSPIPLLLTLPPTSLKSLRDFIGKKLLLKNLRTKDVIVKISLKKDKSADGIPYSKAVFSLVDKLTAEMAVQLKAMAQPDISDDYAEKPASAGTASEDIIDELPPEFVASEPEFVEAETRDPNPASGSGR